MANKWWRWWWWSILSHRDEINSTELQSCEFSSVHLCHFGHAFNTYKCKKLTSLKLCVITIWWYQSSKTAKSWTLSWVQLRLINVLSNWTEMPAQLRSTANELTVQFLSFQFTSRSRPTLKRRKRVQFSPVLLFVHALRQELVGDPWILSVTERKESRETKCQTPLHGRDANNDGNIVGVSSVSGVGQQCSCSGVWH